MEKRTLGTVAGMQGDEILDFGGQITPLMLLPASTNGSAHIAPHAGVFQGPWMRIIPRDMLVAVPCTPRGPGKSRDVPGVAGTSQPVPVPPWQMWVSKLGGPVPTSILITGHDMMVHQQPALGSAIPGPKHPLLGAGWGDTLVPAPPKPPPSRGADRSPHAGVLPSSLHPLAQQGR